MRSRYPLSSDTLWFSLRTCLSTCESAQNRGGSGVFCVCEGPGPQVPVRLPDAAAAATENLFLGICESQVLPPLKGTPKGKCRETTWSGGEGRWGRCRGCKETSILHLPLPPLHLSCTPLFSLAADIGPRCREEERPQCAGKGGKGSSEASLCRGLSFSSGSVKSVSFSG